MSSRRHTPEQIINKLWQAEAQLANGATVGQACKKIGVTDQTHYRWRSEYGGMRVDQAKRLKALEKENTQHKRLVAEQALEVAILRGASRRSFRRRRCPLSCSSRHKA